MRNHNFRYPVTTLIGSRPGNLLDISSEYKVNPGYKAKFLLSGLVSALLEPFCLTEELIYGKRLRNFSPKVPPVFIIGFWRSGTTFLHNLLCCDPRAAFTTTFQAVFPNLMMTQSWWLKPFANRFLPVNRPYDSVRMDMDFPQEEDFGMMNLQPSTIYKFFLYPQDFDRILEQELFTGNLGHDRLDKWKSAYLSMMAKACMNTGGNRYIGKNPCHLARIPILLEMFPGAKFIFIHRHPAQVIESLYRFTLSIFPGVQLQNLPGSYDRRKVSDLYCLMMNAYFRDRNKIPESDLYETGLEDFTSDIRSHLKTIYSKFNLGDYGLASPKIEDYLKGNMKLNHSPAPPEEETLEIVEQCAAEIMKKLGYSL